jgi:hypothetical protein
MSPFGQYVFSRRCKTQTQTHVSIEKPYGARRMPGFGIWPRRYFKAPRLHPTMSRGTQLAFRQSQPGPPKRL